MGKNEAQERVEIIEGGRQNQNHEIPKARVARSGKRVEGLALHIIGEDSFAFFLFLFSPPPPPLCVCLKERETWSLHIA